MKFCLDNTFRKQFLLCLSMENWKTLERRQVRSWGRWLTLEEHTVELKPDHRIDDWLWVKTPHFVNVVAHTASGTWLVFKQTKYAIGELLGKDQTSLAPVGGYIEQDEEPIVAAHRELAEELGLVAGEMIQLSGPTGYVADANRGCGVGHLFLANECIKGESQPLSDDLEEQVVVELSTAEVTKAVLAGEFKCHSWAACVSLALLHLANS